MAGTGEHARRRCRAPGGTLCVGPRDRFTVTNRLTEMRQNTLAMAADQGSDFELYRRPTRRDVFLATMEKIVPWSQLCEVVEPYYPKGVGGRPPVGLERMLRMYFVQHWFNLADVACEEALLDSTALRRFVGIDLRRERVPDGTTLLKFRRLPESNDLGAQLFAKVGEVLQAQGLKIGTGTIVDATIIGAPSSTKNKTLRMTVYEIVVVKSMRSSVQRTATNRRYTPV